MHFLFEARKEPYYGTVTEYWRRKMCRSLEKPAVRLALLDGRLAGAKVVTMRFCPAEGQAPPKK